MDFWELFVIAVGLSMDAFAVSICKGLSTPRLRLRHSLICGGYFGLFQALMPTLGWLLGVQFQAMIASLDHWIAFILLGIIGVNMIRESRECGEESLNSFFSFRTMLPLAVATSIDALAVGVTFAFLQVDIVPAVLFIGYHARENTSRAVLAHTFCSTAFQYYKLDGKEAGELAIDAAYAGELGVPVLFCAGDDACVAEARALFPGLAAVVTKEALSWTSALSRHPQAVCDDIYRTVRAAVPGAGTLVPYCMPGPLSVEIRYKRMEDAARAALTDRNGHPFAQPDPFTRSGVVDGVSALF